MDFKYRASPGKSKNSRRIKSKHSLRSFTVEIGKATMKDLCPEDKARIGELVRRLALEKSLREKCEQKFSSGISDLQQELLSLKQTNSELSNECTSWKNHNERLVNLLNYYKGNSKEADSQSVKMSRSQTMSTQTQNDKEIQTGRTTIFKSEKMKIEEFNDVTPRQYPLLTETLKSSAKDPELYSEDLFDIVENLEISLSLEPELITTIKHLEDSISSEKSEEEALSRAVNLKSTIKY